MSAARRVTLLAVDLGGTKLEAALVDADGRIVPGSRARAATGRDTTPERLTELLADTIGRARASSPLPVRAAGIGSAGPIEIDEGRIHPVNLPLLAGFPLRDTVRALVAPAPVELALDGQCIALAESRFGAGSGGCSMLGMVVSTGVGGGLVIDGRLVRGRTGNAGHVGQLHTSRADENGAVLTVEETASGPASVAWARAKGWPGSTGEELALGWARGEPIPREAVLRSARAVGELVAEVWTLTDLDLVVIGGGFSRVAPEYPELVARAAADHAELPYARSPRVVRAALGDEAPLVGAAALVLG
ncbi:MAG: ROK family protein [Protaetiibacter sp.]